MSATGETQTKSPSGGDVVRRHRVSTRIWHWTNLITIIIMLMSGMAIFNAHPRLYWGEYGATFATAWLEITSEGEAGYIRIGDNFYDTTGVLGYWENPSGKMRTWAFPYWAILPSSSNLAVARGWHLTFAWLFAGAIALYVLWSLFNGHLWRDIVPRPRELGPKNMWKTFVEHILLRFPTGAEAMRYNVLQKLAYLFVLVLFIPTMVLSGLAMSPAMNASWPWLLDLFQGRQSARSVHFITATLLVSFIIVHLVMLLLLGFWNEFKSMITGRFRLPKERNK